MNPRAFLQFDLELVARKKPDQPPEPVQLRSAVSRAYYAVYHVGRVLLKQLGFSLGDSHGDVPNYLQNSGDNKLMKVASELNSLYGARRKADYFLDNKDVESEKKATNHVLQAEELIRQMDGFSQDQQRMASAATFIQNWRKKFPGNP